jgi:hypothetical protein
MIRLGTNNKKYVKKHKRVNGVSFRNHLVRDVWDIATNELTRLNLISLIKIQNIYK